VAELELALSYKNLPARIGLYTMTAMMPVWAIIVPFCLGLFIPFIISQPVPVLTAALIVLTLTLIPVVCIAIAAICEDDRILVSKEGLAFPLFMMPALQFKRERHWGDLSSAQVSIAGQGSPDKGKINGLLTLTFASGGHINLNLSSVARSDLEQFLLAVEVWGKNCHRAPELIEFQNSLQNESRGVDHISYTQMWEEELSRRFSATSFVPLEPEHKLQGGRLKIVRQLAFGGLSAIYLAQQNDKDLVVVKEAVVPANADETSRNKAHELFEREARFLIRLNHKNIARVFDHFAEDGRNYLILEYIRGQDLRQLIKQNGAQPAEHILYWGRQIAVILEYLHGQSPPIIHRDLTPDNLVRKEDDTITLIDFGAANEFVGTATGTLVGKQAYIAPEQLRGHATTRSDIYALGGTLYYLITGSDPEALSVSHPKELVPEVADDIDQFVASLTQLEEEDRPQTAGEIVRLLDKMIDKIEGVSGAHAPAAIGSQEDSAHDA
jgi:tRNA A-37 threonylcarbamoyl transferase component Bud32